VVDDGAENRELVTLVLEDAGLRVEGAENGRIAIDKALARKFDVILMDMQMPVMDGYTATRELRAREIDTPILALTAHAMKGFEKECLEAGCTGYLTKPIDLDALLQTLAEILAVQQSEHAVAPGGSPEPSNAPEPAAAANSAGDEPGEPPIVSRLPTSNPRFLAIVQKFVSRLEEQLLEMENACRDRDYEKLAALAHWLKGSGGTVGFDAFTEPAQRLEQLAKTKLGVECQAVVRELRDLADRIVVPEGKDAPAPAGATHG
jgi:CheY-like chemotaxis protein/HPt (histidine-containing phosphotransfer) domain-containing protein